MQLLKQYKRFAQLGDKQYREQLAKYELQDHAVDLELGTYLKFFPIYKLIETEQQALKAFVQENLQLK